MPPILILANLLLIVLWCIFISNWTPIFFINYLLFFLPFSFSLYFILYYFSSYLILILYTSLLILYFTFFIPFFTYALLCIASTPNFLSLHWSNSQLLMVLPILPQNIFLSEDNLPSTLLSYTSLNLLTPLLILVHLLLIVGLQGRVIFVGVGLFPGLCGFLLAALAQQHTRIGGQSDPQSTNWGKNPPKNDPTTTKTHLHPESKYKWH